MLIARETAHTRKHPAKKGSFSNQANSESERLHFIHSTFFTSPSDRVCVCAFHFCLLRLFFSPLSDDLYFFTTADPHAPTTRKHNFTPPSRTGRVFPRPEVLARDTILPGFSLLPRGNVLFSRKLRILPFCSRKHSPNPNNGQSKTTCQQMTSLPAEPAEQCLTAGGERCHVGQSDKDR